jgi:hypothetical protein
VSTGDSVVLGVPGATVLSETEVSFGASGGLSVTFRGDRADGCAAHGLCAYRGTVSWTAAPGGEFLLVRYRVGARTEELATDSSGDLSSSAEPLTSAEVDRALPGGGVARCGDSTATAAPLGIMAVRRQTAVRVQLLSASTDLLATRCAGPTDVALASISPAVTLPITAIARGRRIDLRLHRGFTAGGLTGTLHSTVALRLGRPHTQSGLGGGSVPPGTASIQERTVSEPLMLTGAAGTITAHVSGDADPLVCSLLDACGLTGSIVLTPRPAPAVGSLTVIGSAKQPMAAYLAALGLGPGHTDGLSASGELDWSDHGQARAHDQQDGRRCSGEIPLQGGGLELEVIAGRLHAAYFSSSDLRGECPGAMVGGDALAVGSAPMSALRRPSFALRLHAAGPITDDGYRGRLSGAVTLRLRPGTILQQTITVPEL